MGWRRAELSLQTVDTEGALREPCCGRLCLEAEGEEDGVWHGSLLAATLSAVVFWAGWEDEGPS